MSEGQILVVDDDPMSLRTFELLLRNQSSKPVVSAPGGEEAVSRLEQDGLMSYDAILTDYRMPNMSGLQLLSWVQRRDPNLCTVMITGEGEKDLVKKALRGGAFDFLEKPFRADQVITTIARAINATREMRATDSTAKEVLSIRDISKQINPELENRDKVDSEKPGHVRTRFYPLKETGGDFVNYFYDKQERLVLFLGDVSGHDLRAGYIATYFQGIVRGMMELGADLNPICDFFNRYLIEEFNKGCDDDLTRIPTSLAACFVLIDFKEHRLTVYNHGLPQPQLCADGLEINDLGEHAPPLGWHAELSTSPIQYELPEKGMIQLWSDGVEELAHDLGLSSATIAESLFSSDEASSQSLIKERKDDVIAVRASWGRQEDAQACETHLLFSQQYPGNGTSQIDYYQKEWKDALTLLLPNLQTAILKRVLLCTREGMLNAMIHGCKGLQDKQCKVEIFQQGETLLSVRVSDEGEGYASATDTLSEPENPQHRSYGMILMRTHSNTLRILGVGQILEMDFKLSGELED